MVFRSSGKQKTAVAGRTRVEQVLRHLGAITEQTREGIIVVDLEGVLHFVNTPWARMHGYDTSSELLGKQISIFHTKEQIKNHIIPFIEQTKRKGRSEGLVEHIRSDGSTFQTQMKMTVLTDEQGKAAGLIVFAADITESTRPEETLHEKTKQDEASKEHIEQLQHQITERRQAQDHLEHQVAELTTANEQLQRETTDSRQAEDHLKQLAAELTTANEQLRNRVAEVEQDEQIRGESTEQIEGSKELTDPLNVEKLKDIADLAKRLE